MTAIPTATRGQTGTGARWSQTARLLAACALTVAGWTAPARAEEPPELSLADLAHTEVTSVSRKQSKLWESPAAVHVITQEEIAGCGCSSVPELLRTVPGLNVARVDDGTWAISARGFNGRFANKMLVLVDGRSVYTSLYSGVHWEQVRVNLDDIERIEVVRGPGATMWGANAVNGIINIITRSAEDTRGALVRVMAGSRETAFGDVRFGRSLGEGGFVRLSGEYVRNASPGGVPADPPGTNSLAQAGLRMDFLRSPSLSMTLHGGFNDGSFARTYYLFETPVDFARKSVDGSAEERDWNLGFSLTRVVSADAELTAGITVDHLRIDDPVLSSDMRSYALDVQQRWRANARHELIVGAGVKVSDDRFGNTFTIQIDPSRQTTHIASLFAQDEISILPRRLIATVGTKYEHNAYTGSEVQPSARLSWLAKTNAMGWLAVSRAVRTPSRIENGGRAIIAALPPGSLGPGTPAVFFTPRGNPDFDSEVVVSYEAGSRWIAHQQLSLDVASYYNRYGNLRTVARGAPSLEVTGGIPYLAVPLVFGNAGNGESYGFEATSDWRVHPRVRLSAGYSFARVNIFTIGDQVGYEGLMWEGSVPRNMAFLSASADLTNPLRLDATLRYMGRLENLVVQAGPPTGAIPEYLALDMRLGVDMPGAFHAYAGGRNLLAGRHGEFMDEVLSPPNAYQVGEEYYAGLRIRF